MFMNRILVVEDEESLRDVMHKLLSRSGYQVDCANNGREAITKVRTRTPDLVITDLIMPEVEGLELICMLRKEFPSLPIIATSGGGRCGPQDYLLLAAKFGAAKVLPKPFTQEQLVGVVTEVLQSRVSPMPPKAPARDADRAY
jgi:CheY-like chemotaxis protein